MDNVEYLLSDEYVEFSKKVADLHTKKKILKDEFKAKFEELQKVLKDTCKAVDEEAKVLVKKWEEWVAGQQVAPPGQKGVKDELRHTNKP